MKPSWQSPGFEFSVEARLVDRWARAVNQDAATLRAQVGLSWAGSPFQPAMHDYLRADHSVGSGPAETEAELLTVAQFLPFLADADPDAHAALTARHRRLVRGIPVRDHGETELARVLHRRLNIGRSAAAERLARDCLRGYQALRRHLTRLKRAA